MKMLSVGKRVFQSPIMDALLTPLVLVSACTLLLVRLADLNRLRLCRALLVKVGVLPVRNHYYEPLFDPKELSRPLSEDRRLPGIDWNEEGQLALLNSFTHSNELEDLPDEYRDETTYYFKNGAFGPGSAEYLYNLIRLKKPKRFIEIGSGHSTKIAVLALKRNREQAPEDICEHICIEPYEMPLLEKMGVTVVRRRVEHVEREQFMALEVGDILFIDSSHVIRPQGDVVYEYLEVLPLLKPGVIVHIHDIFTPFDYPARWLFEDVKLWNEQYLLEAFLTHNKDWKIVGALNYLHHRHYNRLKEKCPRLTPENASSSFYIVRRP